MKSKYKSLTEWKKADPKAYNYAYSNGLLEKIRKKIFHERKPHGFWTLERCIEEAKRFNSTKEWLKNSSGSYSAAKTNGWYEECKIHMKFIYKHKWTFENCVKQALKYNSIKEWIKNSKPSYQAAWRNNWLNECIAHMKIK